MPDLNTNTHQRIGKSKAGWTFETICRLLHHVGRVGTTAAKKAARADQSLGLGLAAIAEESGQSLGKVRRDCAALAELGVIVVTHPNVLMIRDAEGRLTENRIGRSKATVIHLTITEDHLRKAAASRTSTVGLPAADSVHPGRAIQREFQTERTPDGGADGVGTPPAAQDAGLTAGKAPASILPANAGRDEPAMPIGRILPSQRPPKADTGRRRSEFAEDAGPQAFTGEAADAFERTKRRLEAERQAREAEAAGRTPPPPAPPQTPPEAARTPTPPPAAFDQAAAQAAVLAALGVT